MSTPRLGTELLERGVRHVSEDGLGNGILVRLEHGGGCDGRQQLYLLQERDVLADAGERTGPRGAGLVCVLPWSPRRGRAPAPRESDG